MEPFECKPESDIEYDADAEFVKNVADNCKFKAEDETQIDDKRTIEERLAELVWLARKSKWLKNRSEKNPEARHFSSASNSTTRCIALQTDIHRMLIPYTLMDPSRLSPAAVNSIDIVEQLLRDHLYRHFPLNQLVDRCINGPVALEALDISTDVPSALSQYQSTPLEVTDLRIRFVDFSAGSRFPRLIAKSLVSLSLDSVSASTLWEIFVASSTARTADLEFTCLQLLNLQFANISGFIFATQRNHSDPVDFPADPTIPASQYMQSQKYGTPRFPALLKLAVSRFPGQIQELLSLFASSPLQKLKVEGSRFELPSKLDISAFAKLKSLAVSCMGVEDLDPDREYLQQLLHHIFKTPPAQLEYMSLAIGCQEIATDFSQLLEISFADNLRVLRLDSFIDVSGTLLLLLAKLPRLQHLIITSAMCKPLRSIEQVVKTICNEGERLTPVSDSIYMLDLYFGFPGTFVCDTSNKDSSFRGLIPELLCRLPALRILRTKQLYMASEGGPGAVISQVASDHAVSARFSHLQNPWVQQLDASA
ncbi:hypothetical protein LPJ66_001988 [Kickxella alabastrina]|uniref:Uncharacterized protein n=1 Tax=Kickxella alabastrina TaxID=61397 RepID=A0ACC1IRM5_9FUNG|nr:hypothetical protein LPJ66_001988 [Kickxella alabastrina]